MGEMDIESEFFKNLPQEKVKNIESLMNSPFKILNDDKLALFKTNITNYNN